MNALKLQKLILLLVLWMAETGVPKDRVNFGPDVPFHLEKRAFKGRVEVWLSQKWETLSSLQTLEFVLSETRLLCEVWSQGLHMELHQICV